MYVYCLTGFFSVANSRLHHFFSPLVELFDGLSGVHIQVDVGLVAEKYNNIYHKINLQLKFICFIAPLMEPQGLFSG